MLWAAMCIALISMVFANCKKDENEEKEVRTYLVQVAAAEGGTVKGQSGEYKDGEKVVFTAIPADGYYFSQWSDGKNDNPRTINVWNAITLTAEFAAIATVDLGLESGNLWATCNVGAINPWDYGYYYAWGETQTKSDYSCDNYKYAKDDFNTMTKYYRYDNNPAIIQTDDLTTLVSKDDVATTLLGAEYKMPTVDDWKELDSLCYWVWTTNYNKNVSGCIVYKAKSENDKGIKEFGNRIPSASYSLSDAHIFLPAAGFREDANLLNDGSEGFYWSASRYENSSSSAHYCWFLREGVGRLGYTYDVRYFGLPVRPVKRP